jgi:hypothetical protein
VYYGGKGIIEKKKNKQRSSAIYLSDKNKGNTEGLWMGE